MSDNLTYCEECGKLFGQLSSHRGRDVCYDCKYPPPTKEERKKLEKEDRRKQYEKLKEEFGSK